MMSRVLVVAVVMLPAQVAWGYTISTGFTDACHEKITGQAFAGFLFELPKTDVLVPREGDWRRVARFLIGSIGIDPDKLTERQQYLLMSLLVGVRAPDTDGHSILNFDQARALHTDPSPDGQYLHCLRALDDDGPLGNANAVEGARRSIVDSVELAHESVFAAPEDQTETRRIYFDFYGPIEVPAWSPGFWLGQAAHTLQDSFSHTIRNESEGFRTVVSVLNFSEAIVGTLQPSRDGLAHSESMDACKEETEPLVEAATMATRDLFVAAREVFRGRNDEAAQAVVDRWLVLRDGCNASNAFCGNDRWVQVVEEEPTVPPICSAGMIARRDLAGIGGLFLAWVVALRWRRRPGRGL